MASLRSLPGISDIGDLFEVDTYLTVVRRWGSRLRSIPRNQNVGHFLTVNNLV